MGNLVDHVLFHKRKFENRHRSIKVIEEHGIEYLFCKNSESDKIIIYSHGNNEQLDNNVGLIMQLSFICEVSILIYEYPQEPTTESVNVTLLKVYEFVSHHLEYEPEQIFLMGRSIGSCPTMWLASHICQDIKLGGIILISPLSSMHHYLHLKLPFGLGTLVTWIIGERYDNGYIVENIGDCPLLLIHGKEDRVLDPIMSEMLYARYGGDNGNCKLVLEAQHDHISIMTDLYLLEKEIKPFL